MPSRLRQAGQFIAKNKGKIALGIGALAVGGAAAYGAKKLFGNKKSKRQTLAKVRTKRRIWQEKVKLERAKKHYERVMSQ